MHLLYNEYDLAAVTNLVSEAKSGGSKADYDLSRRQEGVVSAAVENWHKRDGSFVVFEIHKLGKKRLIGNRVSWVIQLYSMPSRDAAVIKHGCVSGKMQVTALEEAKLDVMYDFLSVCDFDLACSAAME